ARSTTPTRRRPTSTRSSSGRRRRPTAATARPTARTTRSGSRNGRKSRARAESALAVSSVEAGRPRWAARRRSLAAAFWRRSWLRAALLLVPPLAWFALLYLSALAVLFISAF